MAAPVERKLKATFATGATVMSIDLGHHNAGSEVKRHPKRVEDMSSWGREFYARAALAAEERFGVLSRDELVKAMLDIRTLGYADSYLSEDEQLEAADYLEEDYTAYCITAHEFKMQGTQPGGRAPAAAPPDAEGAPSKRKRSVFARAAVLEPPKQGKSVQNQLKKSYANEFKAAWANWNALAMDTDWCSLFPDEKHLVGKRNDDLDIVEDLMPLDIGPLYEGLSSAKYFQLPMLAKQRLGENMAASFCERMNSIAKDVLDEGHSLLLDQELEAVVVLRANKKFMHMCRGEWLTEINLHAQLIGMPTGPQ